MLSGTFSHIHLWIFHIYVPRDVYAYHLWDTSTRPLRSILIYHSICDNRSHIREVKLSPQLPWQLINCSLLEWSCIWIIIHILFLQTSMFCFCLYFTTWTQYVTTQCCCENISLSRSHYSRCASNLVDLHRSTGSWGWGTPSYHYIESDHKWTCSLLVSWFFSRLWS